MSMRPVMCPRMVVYGLTRAGCARFVPSCQTKAAVNARDDEVEAVQNLVRIVERAILQDVGLNALEDPKAAAIAGVQGVRFGVLSLQVLELQPSGVAGAL